MSEDRYKNPVPTVDIIIEMYEPDNQDSKTNKIVLIDRKNPPYGWAIPGGFVDYGETLEQAATREAYEETGLKVELIRQFHTYSDPARDKRKHTISTVFIARSSGTPRAADDAKEAVSFSIDDLPDNLAFDHLKILNDYITKKY